MLTLVEIKIFTEVDERLSAFGHPARVNASWAREIVRDGYILAARDFVIGFFARKSASRLAT